MRIHPCLVGVTIAVFSSIVTAADCTPLTRIGKIIKIEKEDNNGDAFVVRADCPANERISAKVYQKLYQGDQIEVIGTTKVFVSLARKEKRIFSRETNNQPLYAETVEDLQKSGNIWRDIIDSIPELIGLIGNSLIPVNNSVRHVSQIETGKPAFIMNDPLLPSGIQYLPADYDQVALLWRGGHATAIVSTLKEETIKNSNDSDFMIVQIPQDQKEIMISLRDQKVGWHVKFLATPPVPKNIIQPNATELTARLIRACWILKDGPVEWRLFALSELEKLSKTGFFAADELWNAVLSGELEEVLRVKQ